MGLGVKYSSIVPYTSVFIDCSFCDILYGIGYCLSSKVRNDIQRESLCQDLHHFFITEQNPNCALVCLSARTAFDLFLSSKNYPVGSEIIFSAINIPDMPFIARHHGLKVVPCDINIETMGPRIDFLEQLISCRTVAVVVAHLFGRWFDISDVVQITSRYSLDLIEDCAEAFCGFEYLGHPSSDLSLFSFGPIKYCTAFGGAIAKVRSRELYTKMRETYESFPVQENALYLTKLAKCLGTFVVLDVPQLIKPGMFITDKLGIDHKRFVVNSLRGFPSNLIQRLRHRPSEALLRLLLRRFRNFDEKDFQKSATKGEFMWQRLPTNIINFGSKVVRNNYWLFPVLVEDPVKVALELNRLGIDAYVGASQLTTVLPEQCVLYDEQDESKRRMIFLSPKPAVAEFFMDHVIYLPVNKTVPFSFLEKMVSVLNSVAYQFCPSKLNIPVAIDLYEHLKAKL